VVKKKAPKKRVSIAGVLLRLGLAAAFWWVILVGVDVNRVIPAGWNPFAPFHVSDPITPLTQWRLTRALSDADSCLAALDGVADFVAMPDFEATEQCNIKQRVRLSRVGEAEIKPLETQCAVAVRMAMWERYSLQPAANQMGTSVATIDQIGSYSCREMRTESGSAGRMSTHATASAIDITGFRFSDGETARLTRDWDAADEKAAFLRKAKMGACEWFRVTLSPDYNALHADHFHLQSKGWGGCR
tara:strand:- start:10662 stop:11396 length:735 start_codon:yes stop_codon:yes gene_type:complete